MPNTRRERELLLPYDNKLECTLHIMNHNLGINDNDPNQYISATADARQLLPDDNLCGN